MINFEKTSKTKMFWITVSSYIAYFLLSIVAPVITICIKYDLFNGKGTHERIAINGWALVGLLIVGVLGATLLKKAIKKIPDVKIKTARFKYALETISGVIPAVLAICIIHLFKVNLETACSTAYWVACWYLAAALVDGVLISGVDRENNLRAKAAEKIEVEKRVDKI